MVFVTRRRVPIGVISMSTPSLVVCTLSPSFKKLVAALRKRTHVLSNGNYYGLDAFYRRRLGFLFQFAFLEWPSSSQARNSLFALMNEGTRYLYVYALVKLLSIFTFLLDEGCVMIVRALFACICIVLLHPSYHLVGIST